MLLIILIHSRPSEVVIILPHDGCLALNSPPISHLSSSEAKKFPKLSFLMTIPGGQYTLLALFGLLLSLMVIEGALCSSSTVDISVLMNNIFLRTMEPPHRLSPSSSKLKHQTLRNWLVVTKCVSAIIAISVELIPMKWVNLFDRRKIPLTFQQSTRTVEFSIMISEFCDVGVSLITSSLVILLLNSVTSLRCFHSL